VVEEPDVTIVGDAVVWLNDPLNWQGKNGVPFLTYEHLYISGLAVLLAAVLAVPTALALGHIGRGGALTVTVTNVTRAIPTLALLTVFAATAIGFGNRATIIALSVFAIPPLLTNTYVGIRGVDRDIVEAARGMGMTTFEVIRKVELPLAVPTIMGGVRTGATNIVATATIAPLAGVLTLGDFILNRNVYGPDGVLAGAILVALLALAVELTLAAAQRLLTPRGIELEREQARAAT